jgi:hypothetical protein
MRKFGRIEGGHVVEVFDLDEHHPERPGIDGLFHPSILWLAAPDEVVEGWPVFEGVIVAADDYRVRRVKEYPPLMDFIDGMVKVHSANPKVSAEGDAQVQAYCATCLAVKAKFPKD